MLSFTDGENTVKLARAVIESHVREIDLKFDVSGNIFDEKLGVFVTIHSYPNNSLRGCIGIPEPILPLKRAIIDSSRSATRDPRFPQLGVSELENIKVEVTVLSKPEIIKVSKHKDYFSEIKIGEDGLIVEQGFFKGLLLPQVPVEQNWDVEDFLSNTCMKAGLLPDAWVDENTKIYKFSGQIFTEITPRGEIKEKVIDGSNS